jgi:hypothetical protein
VVRDEESAVALEHLDAPPLVATGDARTEAEARFVGARTIAPRLLADCAAAEDAGRRSSRGPRTLLMVA